MTTELIRASHAMDKVLADLRQVEQERDEARRFLRSTIEAWQSHTDAIKKERDEARRHLQEIVNAYDDATNGDIVDAIHLAAIYLKGGI